VNADVTSPSPPDQKLSEFVAKAWFEEILVDSYSIQEFPDDFCDVMDQIMGRVALSDLNGFAGTLRTRLPQLVASDFNRHKQKANINGTAWMLRYALPVIAAEWAVQSGKIPESHVRYFCRFSNLSFLQKCSRALKRAFRI
jgi:hypothetical protein